MDEEDNALLSTGMEDGRSFLMLVERETLRVENVEDSFFKAVGFKKSQRNLELFKELKMDDIFMGVS